LLGRIYYEQGRLYLAFDQLFEATKLEKSGARFEVAKKLIDVQLIMDEKLSSDDMALHMPFCLARSAAISPEDYRKRFPGAETYVDDLNEEKYVLESFATMVAELSPKTGAVKILIESFSSARQDISLRSFFRTREISLRRTEGRTW
jgi:hypothetical protein